MRRAPLLACLPAALLACTDPAPPPVPATSVSVQGGLVTLAATLGDRRPFTLRDAAVRVRVDGKLYASAGASCRAVAGRPLACDLGDGLSLVLAAEDEAGGLLLRATVSGTAGARVDGFELLSTRSGEGELVVPASPSRLRYLHNGYQSWSFAGALDAPDRPLARRDDVLVHAAPNGHFSENEEAGLSSHSAVLDGGDGTALVLGFVTAERWQGALALEDAERRGLVAQSGFTGDSVTIPAGGSVSSETLFVKLEASPEAAMRAYGLALARRQPARAAPASQRGWFSWNRWFEAADEATVLEQAALMKPLLGGAGFELVVVDDGWERAWGDWTPNSKFRSVRELAQEIHGRGQKLGLWLAPLVAEQSLPVVAEHPDWWVRTAAGELLVHVPLGTTHRLVVVDGSHPDARAWAAGHLARLVADGVDFFKLDFLYAGALDGKRRDPQATGVAALSSALDALFSAAGGAGVNLCGVPWLHAALAPASTMRIGNDVAAGTGTNGFFQVGDAARNLAARAFGPLAARADPDQLRLSYLTAREAWTAAVVQALATETFGYADDPRELDEARRGALVQAGGLAPPTGDLLARGPFDDAGTEVLSPIYEFLTGPGKVQTKLPAVLVRGPWLAATNWGDEAAEVDLRLAPGEAATVERGPAPSGGRVRLESHETGLYRLAR